jgi:predicted amidohydrolase YtcJ
MERLKFISVLLSILVITACQQGKIDNAAGEPDQNKPEDSKQDFIDIQDYYASYGFTTAQDGFTDPAFQEYMEPRDKEGLVKMDIVTLIGYSFAEEFNNKPDFEFRNYSGNIKITGVKVNGDGSPQGKTAYMSKPYLTEVPGCTHECRGIPFVRSEQLNEIIANAHKHHAQVHAHFNGNASIDDFLTAHRYAEVKLNVKLKERRSIVVHTQFMRPELIDTFTEFGIFPSYFTNHTFFWVDVPMINMGKKRAYFIRPIKSSLEKDIKFANHTDFKVTPHNQLFTVCNAVNQVLRGGAVIVPDECVTPYVALKAITDWTAFMNFEEDKEGTLEVGKLADLVILDKNPLKVDPMAIKDIQLVETIKEGITIYKL